MEGEDFVHESHTAHFVWKELGKQAMHFPAQNTCLPCGARKHSLHVLTNWPTYYAEQHQKTLLLRKQYHSITTNLAGCQMRPVAVLSLGAGMREEGVRRRRKKKRRRKRERVRGGCVKHLNSHTLIENSELRESERYPLIPI